MNGKMVSLLSRSECPAESGRMRAMQHSRREFLETGAAAAAIPASSGSDTWRTNTDADTLMLKLFMSIEDEQSRLYRSIES
jgi:hypothetical protein